MSAVRLDDLPETVTAAQLRAALGADGATITRMIKAGTLPPPLPGVRRWYRDAVKAKLREASGLDCPADPESTIAAEAQEILRGAKTWGTSR
jgi:hypothetical protein